MWDSNKCVGGRVAVASASCSGDSHIASGIPSKPSMWTSSPVTTTDASARTVGYPFGLASSSETLSTTMMTAYMNCGGSSTTSYLDVLGNTTLSGVNIDVHSVVINDA